MQDPTRSGRRVLVTGATGGIGGAIAEAFAAEGETVVATGRDRDRLAELVERCREAPGSVETIAGDLTDEAFAARLAEAAAPVDVLVNSVGWVRHVPFLESDPADWERSWRLNVHSVLVLTRLVARDMAARGTGQIVNLGSVLGDRVYRYTLFYAATKHALRGISRGLRLELAEHGVKVTEIAPGLVGTGLLDRVDHPEVLEAYAARKYPPLEATDIAQATVAATRAAPNACPELVVVNPMGQTT